MNAIKPGIDHLVSLAILILAIAMAAQTHELFQAAIWLWVGALFLVVDFAPRRWWQ